MLYGTGQLLMITDLEEEPPILKRILFEAFELVEANRAMIFGPSDSPLSSDLGKKLRSINRHDFTPEKALVDGITVWMVQVATFIER